MPGCDGKAEETERPRFLQRVEGSCVQRHTAPRETPTRKTAMLGATHTKKFKLTTSSDPAMTIPG